jgi:CHAT domain-containing protein
VRERHDRLTGQERALRDALARPEGDPLHRSYPQVRVDLAAVVGRRRALEVELLEDAGVEIDGSDLAALQALPLLRDGHTALLSLAATEHGTLALLLTCEGVRHRVIEDLSDADVRAWVQGPDEEPEWGGWLGAYLSRLSARRALADAAFWAALMPGSDEHRRTLDRARAAWHAAVVRWRETLAETLEALGKRLWPKLDAMLGAAGVERVVLVPQGLLFLLPLHACPLDGGQPLGERYAVAYAPAGAVLARLAAEDEGSRLGQSLLVANPTGDLAYTPSEALAVEEALEDAVTLWEREATQARVVAAAREASVVHFSGHGAYDWHDPEQSALLLRDPRFERVNWRTHEGVDPFTVAEMRGQLRLARTRLVTLSACETGLGEFRRGLADEYIGLPGILLQAGTRAVVASLWAVDDLATALLMGRFYEEWRRGAVAVAEALRRAQRWLRTRTRAQVDAALADLDERWEPWRRYDADPAMKGRAVRQYWKILDARDRLKTMDDPPFAHPYWWAAFQAVGDVL